ncbi:LAFA_0F17964g1_1 [Lachancea sp. 'fantastica']|nr:LAFA_0F17964g1_1 [Lachancea sp. 'fantastica']
MGLGINKKPRKVPDLSRYDYHYQTKNENDTGSRLSAAAAAASTGRSQSLVHSRKPVHARPETAGYRSHSLRHNGNSERVGSLTRAGKRPASAAAPAKASSRSNSMVTVHTTEVRDLSGRTHSITKKTVRRVNGYEYVETTTTTTNSAVPQDSERQFNEFTTDLSRDVDSNYDQQHQYLSELDRFGAGSGVSDTLREEDNEDDDEDNNNIDIDDADFSDAVDYLPQRKLVEHRPKAVAPRKVKRQEKPKKALTEQEIYAKALEAARKKVYGENEPEKKNEVSASRPQPAVNRMSSLRENPVGAVPQERVKRRSFSLKMLAQKQGRPESEAVLDPNPSVGEKKTQRGQPPTNARISTRAPPMTNEEIHAKAVELARARYAAGENLPSTEIHVAEGSYAENTRQEGQKAEDPPSKPAGSGSKVKNFFSKVAQFSQENYGYQNKNGKQFVAETRSDSGKEAFKLDNEDRLSGTSDSSFKRQELPHEDRFHDKVNNFLEPEIEPSAKIGATDGAQDSGAIEDGGTRVQGPIIAVTAEPLETDAPDVVLPVQPQSTSVRVLEREPQEPAAVPVTALDGPPAPTDVPTASPEQMDSMPVQRMSSDIVSGEELVAPAIHEPQPRASTLASSVSSSQANFSRQSVRGSLAGKKQELQQPKLAGGSINEVPEVANRPKPTEKSSQKSTKKPNFLQKLFKRSSRKTKQN